MKKITKKFKAHHPPGERKAGATPAAGFPGTTNKAKKGKKDNDKRKSKTGGLY